MTREELYLARILFKLKVYTYSKQAYEDFFVNILQQANPNFQPVKPQGRYGDRKNDGFDRNAGIYYQVYAPEDLRWNEDEAVDKLEKDFKGVHEYWSGNGFPFKEFYYVVNDKYHGNYPTLINAVHQISVSNNIKTGLLRCKDLEEIFLKLDEQQIIDIIGILPDPSQISDIKIEAMQDVIDHLTRYEMPDRPEMLVDPNFDRKIVFNKISKHVANFLTNGFYHSFIIKDYFEWNSSFQKEELRKIFSGLYDEAKKNLPEGETKNDEIFFYIVNAASPRKAKAIQDAVYVLISYYFEFCDIFETPKDSQQGSLFK